MLLQHPQLASTKRDALQCFRRTSAASTTTAAGGERVVAALRNHAGRQVDADEIKAFVKARIGSVKAPRQIEVWDDLSRSKVGKVLKKEVRAVLMSSVG